MEMGGSAGPWLPDAVDRRRTAAIITNVLGVEARVPSDCVIERLVDAARAVHSGAASWRRTASKRRIDGLYVYAALRDDSSLIGSASLGVFTHTSVQAPFRAGDSASSSGRCPEMTSAQAFDRIDTRSCSGSKVRSQKAT
jgi:hypothetical protein